MTIKKKNDATLAQSVEANLIRGFYLTKLSYRTLVVEEEVRAGWHFNLHVSRPRIRPSLTSTIYWTIRRSMVRARWRKHSVSRVMLISVCRLRCLPTLGGWRMGRRSPSLNHPTTEGMSHTCQASGSLHPGDLKAAISNMRWMFSRSFRQIKGDDQHQRESKHWRHLRKRRQSRKRNDFRVVFPAEWRFAIVLSV